MSPQAWGHVAIGLDLASFPVYVAGILRPDRAKRNRPERAGWFMYAALYFYTTAAQFTAGALWSNGIAATEAVGCSVIAGLSVRYGKGGFGRGVQACFAAEIIALAAWPLLSPADRVVAVVAVDALATTLVVRSARRNGGESLWSWALYGLAGGAAVGAVGYGWPSILYLYPLAAEAFGMAVVTALLLHRLDQAEARLCSEQHQTEDDHDVRIREAAEGSGSAGQ